MDRMTDRELEIIVANCLAEGNEDLLSRAVAELERRGLLSERPAAENMA